MIGKWLHAIEVNGQNFVLPHKNVTRNFLKALVSRLKKGYSVYVGTDNPHCLNVPKNDIDLSKNKRFFVWEKTKFERSLDKK